MLAAAVLAVEDVAARSSSNADVTAFLNPEYVVTNIEDPSREDSKMRAY
jgi:hypothetical protein